PGSRRSRRRVPAQGRAQVGGEVGQDLDVVLVGEGEGEGEGDLVDLAGGGGGVEAVGQLGGGADEVGGEEHAGRALGGGGAGQALGGVVLVLPALLGGRAVGGDD